MLHGKTPWKWTEEHERLFQTLKISLTSNTELTIPNTKHPIFITVDASLIGLGAVLFQLNEQNQMKVISYNSRILNPQEQKLSTLERELLGIVHALQIYEFIIIGSPYPIHVFTDHKPLLHCFTKKGNLSPRFYRAQMQLTKFSKLKIIHIPGKNLSVADLLSRSFFKEELHINQLKHKHLPLHIDFTILQNNKLKPVHYLIKHEEVLPHQKHDSHPILEDYDADQFSLRINKKGNDNIVKPLKSFSFNTITPFQTKFKAPVKKHNKPLHQQSLLLNDTDVTSDHIYTRIPKDSSSFSPAEILDEQETFSTITKPKPTIKPKSSSEITSAIDVQTNSTSMTYSSQLVPFQDPSFFKYKMYFQGFFLSDDYSLDLKTLQVQQSQDPVLRTVHSWFSRNEKSEFLTPLITGNLLLHAYYKRFKHFFIDTTTNLVCLYLTNPLPPETHPISIPNLLHSTIRICLPFRMFQTVFNKVHDHSHTGFKTTYNTFSQYYYYPYLEKWLSIFIHDCLECQKNKHFNMKSQTAPHNRFQNTLLSSITESQWIPKDLLILLHNINHTFTSSLTLLATLLSPFQSNRTMQKLQLKPYYIIGLQNMALPSTLSLILAQNMLIKIWPTFVHLWVLDTPNEQLILLGQMAFLKYKIEISAHTFVCFFITPLKIGLFKYTCKLTHAIPNQFQNSMILLSKKCFTQDPESH